MTMLTSWSRGVVAGFLALMHHVYLASPIFKCRRRSLNSAGDRMAIYEFIAILPVIELLIWSELSNLPVDALPLFLWPFLENFDIAIIFVIKRAGAGHYTYRLIAP